MARAHLNRQDKRALVLWVCTIVVASVIGIVLNRRGTNIVLPTPPILANFPGTRDAGLLLPAVVGSVLVLALPRLCQRLGWRTMLVVTALGSLAWTVALARAEGPQGLTRGPSWWTEYLHDLPSVQGNVAGFLRNFTDNIDDYAIHVRGHPPGFVVLLAGMHRVGLRGASGEAVLVLAAATTAPIAVLLSVAEVAGQRVARAAAPWLALSPAAIWIGTSADAFYMALTAWAITLVILGTRYLGRDALPYSIGAGLFAAAALLGTYGVAVAAAIPLAVIIKRRAYSVALVAATTAVAALALLWMVSGFSWWDGLHATIHEYQVLDLDRGYVPFVFINLGAWAIALGPAVALGLARAKKDALWLLVGGGLAAALIANFSGLSSGEVERIWLPFTIWVLPVGAAIGSRGRLVHLMLAAQAISAIALIALVRTPW